MKALSFTLDCLELSLQVDHHKVLFGVDFRQSEDFSLELVCRNLKHLSVTRIANNCIRSTDHRQLLFPTISDLPFLVPGCLVFYLCSYCVPLIIAFLFLFVFGLFLKFYEDAFLTEDLSLVECEHLFLYDLLSLLGELRFSSQLTDLLVKDGPETARYLLSAEEFSHSGFRDSLFLFDHAFFDDELTLTDNIHKGIYHTFSYKFFAADGRHRLYVLAIPEMLSLTSRQVPKKWNLLEEFLFFIFHFKLALHHPLHIICL